VQKTCQVNEPLRALRALPAAPNHLKSKEILLALDARAQR